MNCPFCARDGNSDIPVTPGLRFTTLIGSSGGNDPNWKRTGYDCANGHRFEVIRRDGELPRVRDARWMGAGVNWRAPDEFTLPEDA